LGKIAGIGEICCGSGGSSGVQACRGPGQWPGDFGFVPQKLEVWGLFLQQSSVADKPLVRKSGMALTVAHQKLKAF